jgi:hypothetical protein
MFIGKPFGFGPGRGHRHQGSDRKNQVTATVRDRDETAELFYGPKADQISLVKVLRVLARLTGLEPIFY